MSLAIDQFRKAVSPFSEDWQSIEIRVIAYQFHGVWFFNAFRAEFGYIPAAEPTRKDVPTVSNLLVAHERWSIERIDDLLKSVLKGEVAVGDNVIHIKRFDGQNLKPDITPSFRFRQRSDCRSDFGIDFASFVLEEYESSHFTYEERQIIDHQLRSASIPWDGLTDLRQNFVGLEMNLAARNDSLLYIIAPLYMRLRESTLEEARVRAILDKTIKTDQKEISLAVIAHSAGDLIERVTQPIQKGEAIIDLKSQPMRAIVMLRYRDFIVDRTELFGKSLNRRIKVFQNLRGDLQDLVDELKENGKRLEANVCLLFHLLGFSPAHYGYGTDEVPDIIAFLEPGSREKLLVIECTQREPDLGNKLTKLATRSKEISRELDGSPILPILITGLERPMINKTDEEKAMKENIAVVTYNEILTLIQMALKMTSPKEVLDYLSGLIPRTPIGY
jgi:hypothetical protein